LFFKAIPDFLSPFLRTRYYTLGIQFHHIHHYSTRVACYNLEKCYSAAPKELWDGITIVDGPMFWNAMNNVMFDEKTRRLVPFE
jgi:omega-6 fatty acid desaturase (delta-12 desaturase)